MDGEGLAHWRMRNLRLWGASFERPEEVVGWLGGVQSQDYGPAKWSLAERTGAADDAAVERAFADGAILRTHVLRPTWHFVLPADIRWMLELTGPRVHVLNGYQYRQLGLDEGVLRKATALLVDALRGGNQLTRKVLGARLEAAGIATSGFRLAYVLMNAELNGVVCSGALDGRRHTYALLDERVPRAPSRSRDEALAELVLRYFSSHGPATAKDLGWWSSLTMADVREGIEMVASRLERVDVDGVSYWFAEPAPPTRPPSPRVHLLQGYDEYVVGYSESKYVLDVSGAARSLTQDGIPFNSVVILDGQVAGHWKRTMKGRSVLVEVALYRPLDDGQAAALQAAADRYAAFLGVTASVTTAQL
jgi:DNA glycosylase AlkZ-like